MSQSEMLWSFFHNLGKEAEILTIFYIWSDTEFLTLILGVSLVQTFRAAKLKMCVKCPGFRICSFVLQHP